MIDRTSFLASLKLPTRLSRVKKKADALTIADLAGSLIISVEWKEARTVNDSTRDIHAITSGWLIQLTDDEMIIAWGWDDAGVLNGLDRIQLSSVIDTNELNPPYRRREFGTRELVE